MSGGKNKFFEGIYCKYYYRILRYCSAVLGCDSPCVEDCVQDVFKAALKNADKLSRSEDVERWLFVTAYNISHKYYFDSKRRQKIEAPLFAYENSGGDGSPPSFEPYEFTDEEIEALKGSILSSLDGQQLELYRLRYEKKLSYQQISNELGLKLTTVRMRLYRLNITLHELIENIF